MGPIPWQWFVAVIVIVGALVLRSLLGKERQVAKNDRYGNPTGETETVAGDPLARKGFLALVAVAVVLVLSSFVAIVPGRTVAIPTTLGVVGKPIQSGTHIVNPFTDLSKWTLRTKDSTMVANPKEGDKPDPDAVVTRGSDLGELSIDVTVVYNVIAAKADELYKRYPSLDDVRDKIIRPAVRSKMRDVATQWSAADTIAQQRSELERQTTELVQAEMAPIGIEVTKVYIRAIVPAANVKTYIEQKQAAVQQAETAKVTQGQAQTEAETRRKVAETDAEAARQRAQGEADAARIAADAKAYANDQITKSLTPELIEYTKALALSQANTIYVPTNVTPIIGLPSPSTTAAPAK